MIEPGHLQAARDLGLHRQNLQQKLRELDRTVIGVGVKGSTSKLLPPACDEFLFYENLDGVDAPQAKVIRRGKDQPVSKEQDLDGLDDLVAGEQVTEPPRLGGTEDSTGGTGQ